jgi:hypothetical protein
VCRWIKGLTWCSKGGFTQKQHFRSSTVELASQSWRLNWDKIIPFMDYPIEIRKMIYTTNIIEDALMKPLYLAFQQVLKRKSLPSITQTDF